MTPSKNRPNNGPALWRTLAMALLALDLLVILATSALFVSKGGMRYLRDRRHSAEQARVPFEKSILYTGRADTYAALPSRAAERPIVFLGDSLIAWGNWDERVRPEIPANVAVLTRGIVSDTIDGVTLRLPEALRHRPRVLIVYAGINDLMKSDTDADVAHILDRYRYLLSETAKESPQTHVVLQSLLPVDPDRFDDPSRRKPNLAQRIDQVNQQLSALADGKTVFFLNAHDNLLDRSSTGNERIAPDDSIDGVHLTPAGYAIWQADVVRLLKGLAG